MELPHMCRTGGCCTCTSRLEVSWKPAADVLAATLLLLVYKTCWYTSNGRHDILTTVENPHPCGPFHAPPPSLMSRQQLLSACSHKQGSMHKHTVCTGSTGTPLPQVAATPNCIPLTGSSADTTCLLPVYLQSGSIKHENDSIFLDEDQVAAGFLLPCVAYPTSDLVVVTHQEEEMYTHHLPAYATTTAG